MVNQEKYFVDIDLFDYHCKIFIKYNPNGNSTMGLSLVFCI